VKKLRIFSRRKGKRPGEEETSRKSSEEKTKGLRAQKGASLLACVEEKLSRYKELYAVVTPGNRRRRTDVFHSLTQEA
jgi:hypothetical protein